MITDKVFQNKIERRKKYLAELLIDVYATLIIIKGDGAKNKNRKECINEAIDFLKKSINGVKKIGNDEAWEEIELN